MSRLTTIAVLLAAALGAGAEEVRWKFEKGRVREYEAETVLEWSAAGSSSPLAKAGRKERQVETVRIRLEVKAVDERGNAEIAGSFPAVKVTHTGSVGKVEWDSEEAKTTGFLGYKRYEGLRGVTFTARVSPDGRVLESSGAGRPDRAQTPGSEKEHVEALAFAVHDPTTPRAWLELIFGAVPPSKKNTRRTVRWIEEESISISFARHEKSGGRPGAKSVLETPDRPHNTDPRAIGAMLVSDPGALAWAAIRGCAKKAETWFSLQDGELIRFEGEADTTLGYDEVVLVARMTWTIQAWDGKRRK